MIMKRIKWFLPLLCLSFILGCSSDFKDPEKVVRSYYEAVFSSNRNFDKAYKYLSSESQRHADLNEFRKDLTETFPNVNTRQITQLNILPEDKGYPAYRRVKITFDHTDNGNSTQNEVRYYTLIKENNNWKIAWSSPTNLYKKRDEGLYNEAIKLAEEILSIDPYDTEAYVQMGYCYYHLNNPEKSVANIRNAIALSPEANDVADFINNHINNDSLGNCSDSEDNCLYSKISIYYKTWEINNMIADSKFNEAWGILQSIKQNIKEATYKEIAEDSKNREIQSMVKESEFSVLWINEAWKTLKSAKPHLTKDAYDKLAAMIEEEQNKPISTGIADFEESWSAYMGRNVTISGYLSLYKGYGEGLPAIYQICEKTFNEGLCFQNITILKDVLTNVDSVELRRKFKEMSGSAGLYVTVTGKVRKYMGVANEYEVYEITFR